MDVSLKVAAVVLGLGLTFGASGAAASPSDKELTAMEEEAMSAIEQDFRDRFPAEMAKQFQMIMDSLPKDGEDEGFAKQPADNDSEDTI